MRIYRHLLRRATACALLFACAATATAQSVVIYGKVDVGISKRNSGTSNFGGGGGAPNVWTVLGGADSVLGFRGEEDLGGGMKARFKIEQRFNADSGSFRSTGTAQNPPPAWWGESTVSLDTPYGGIDLGRMNPAPGALPVFADPFMWDTVGSTVGMVAPNGFGPNDILKYNNGVMLRTPRWNGLGAQLGVGLGEGGPRGRSQGFNVTYISGPLWAGIGHEQRKTAVLDKFTILMAMYNFGPIKPIIAASQSEIAGVSKSFYSLGAIAPVGSGDLKAVYAVGHPRNFPTTLAPKTTKLGLGYHYWLSKRTKLYTDIGSSKSEGFTRTTAYDAGLQHNF